MGGAVVRDSRGVGCRGRLSKPNWWQGETQKHAAVCLCGLGEGSGGASIGVSLLD